MEEFAREEYVQGSTAKEAPSVEEFCNEQQQKEGTSALESPSVGEFVKTEHSEGRTKMETLSVNEFVNEKVPYLPVYKPHP